MKFLMMVALLFFAVGTVSQAEVKSGQGWLIVHGHSSFNGVATFADEPVKVFDTFNQCETKRKKMTDADAWSCQHFNAYHIPPKEYAIFKFCLQSYTAFPPAGIRPCMSAATFMLSQNKGNVPGNHDEQVNFRAFEAAKCFHFAAIGESQINDTTNAKFLFSASQSILNAIISNNVSPILTNAAKTELKYVNKQYNSLKPTERA